MTRRLFRLGAVLLLPAMLLVWVQGAALASSTQLVGRAGPSWQTNGGVWALAYANGRVYLGGTFTAVRPPGAAVGSSEVARSDLAAFDSTTGQLVQEFDPNVNGAVYSLKVSPDGRTLYAGGAFTTVSGQPRQHIAALDITSAAGPITSWAPALDGITWAIDTSPGVVWAGGAFGTAMGQRRTRAAAFTTAGALLPWAPALDATVRAVLLAPSGDRVVLGGEFNTVNGEHHRAIGSVDATGGTTNRPMDDGIIPFCTTACTGYSVVKSIVTDGTSLYVGAEGTGGGWFDGTLKVDPLSGHLTWKDNCLGATQAVVVIHSVLYGGSHAHDCTAVASGVANGFGQDPKTKGWHHLTAESLTDGTLLPWFPNTNGGPTVPYAVDEVGPRALATDGTQLFVGGHFSTVNDQPQQGFTRFGTGPDDTAPGKPLRPAVASNTPGTAVVHWLGTSDLDDGNLTYKVYRGTTLIATVAGAESRFWRSPQFSVVDSGLQPGRAYGYSVEALDPSGNSSGRSTQAVVTVATSPTGGYPVAVGALSPLLYWRLDDSDASAVDSSGHNHTGTYAGGVTQGRPGVLTGSPGATLQDGYVVDGGDAAPAPPAYSLELWFRTTTVTGGRLIGFGDSRTGISSHHDRQIYMNNSGQLMFGVYPGSTAVAWSKDSDNDGTWHHVVATQDGSGMNLYVGGVRKATNTAASADKYSGYWRVGNDNLDGWPRQPTSSAFEGDVDEAAVYPFALTAAEVTQHFAAAQ